MKDARKRQPQQREEFESLREERLQLQLVEVTPTRPRAEAPTAKRVMLPPSARRTLH